MLTIIAMAWGTAMVRYTPVKPFKVWFHWDRTVGS